jgi:D-glycero-beta-D-manno-heptose-7-phosphate kinase
LIELIRQVDFSETEQRFKKIHIGVIGDVMLDIYHDGPVSRISPEAPVPIVDVRTSVMKPGGAANVCRNVRSLGASCSVFGVAGSDGNGKILKALFENDGVDTGGLIFLKDRLTTSKMRIVSDGQQLVRLDFEQKKAIHNKTVQKILKSFEKQAPLLDAVIFQDYNKGVLTPALIQGILNTCRDLQIRVFVDPKFENYAAYKNVFLFKPNRKEASELLQMDITSPEEACKAASEFRKILNAEYVLITLGEGGMVLMEEGEACLKIPTRARKIHDVTGAGDTVISTVTVFCAAGYSLPISTVMANLAAGKVCEEVGIIPITLKALKEISTTIS